MKVRKNIIDWTNCNAGWVQLKVLLGIFAIGAMLLAIMAVVYFWQNMIYPEKKVISELNLGKKLTKDNKVRPDPGLIRYEDSKSYIISKDYINARDKLYEVLKYYQNSIIYDKARELLGEMNLDLLYSSPQFPGKKNYTVKAGDSIIVILKKLRRQKPKIRMTISFMMYLNNLISYRRLYPDQQLVVFDLDFSILINLSKKRLTLNYKNEFFKDFKIIQYKIPSKISIPSTIKVTHRKFLINNKTIDPSRSNSLKNKAKKWLVHSKSGFIIRHEENKQKNGDQTFLLENFGIVLSKSDMEDLFPIVPNGTKITINK